jgi:hypothetical protein
MNPAGVVHLSMASALGNFFTQIRQPRNSVKKRGRAEGDDSTRTQLPKVRHEHDGEVFMGPEHQYCK